LQQIKIALGVSTAQKFIHAFLGGAVIVAGFILHKQHLSIWKFFMK
jgi:hypothetical protein